MPQSNSDPQSASNRHWGFSTAGRVFFGWGVLEELRTVGKEFGKRVMVCSDKNIIKSGIADKVETLLKEGGAEVLIFPDGRPEIDLKLIETTADVARQFNPDVMIGVGRRKQHGSRQDQRDPIEVRRPFDEILRRA
jgi:alcohol dehydrogenase YqhD (iron-dependent ADH family)